MRKKILITGNKGFLGSALHKYLEIENEVFGIDLKDDLDLFNIDSILGVDIVIHCAALTSVTESMKKPYEYYKNNVLGTAHMMKLCNDFGAQLIHISSAAIYEPNTSIYADSKLIAHDIVSVFQKSLIFIPYNIYAIKPKKGSLFDHFLFDKELYINGDGKQTRDFINITDVCEIIKTAIDEEWEVGTFELGTGEDIAIKDIANIFHELTEKDRVYRKQSGGIRHSVADIEHLRNHYKKPFKTNLREDIEKMIDSFN